MGVLAASWSSAEEEADEVVEDEDARRARDDRGVDAAADAGRAAGGRQAEVAARERDDEAEDDALDEAVRDVAEAEQAAGEAVVEAPRLDCRSACPENAAPKSASASAKRVIVKSVTTMAMKRGAMRNAIGSMARARSASICSVTTIVPSSAVLLAPTRPGDHERGEQRRDLAERAEAGAPAEEALGAVALDDGGRLDDHDGAR